MKAAFLLFGKGILIGAANIAPGLSGSVLSVSLGLYEPLLSAVAEVRRKPGRALRLLFPFGMGALFGVLILSQMLEWLMLQFPRLMKGLFLALAIGCIPSVWREVKKGSFRPEYLFAFLGGAAVASLPMVFGSSGGDGGVFSVSPQGLFLLFLLGNLAAFTLIVPGISGSLLLTAMGYYLPLLTLVNDTAEAFLGGSLGELLRLSVLFFPFVIGVAVGGLLVSRGMTWLFRHCRTGTYWAILGVVAASPVGLLIQLFG